MAKTFGDEIGLLWQKQVYVGRSASSDQPKVGKLPDPVGYEPPEYRSILDCERIALDIETSDPFLLTKGPGVYRKDGYILGVAIDYGDGDRRYYPLRHSVGSNMDEERFYSCLAAEGRNFQGTIVGANLQYDLDWLGSQNVRFDQAKFFDVQYAEPLIDENKLSYKLDLLAKQYCGIGKFKSTLEKHYGDDFIKYLKDIHPAHVAEYAQGDVYLPLEIMDKQLPILKSQGLEQICDIEHRLLPMLLQMRRTGVRVDVPSAERAERTCLKEAAEISTRMIASVGFDVEIFAAESIARAFDTLGLEYPRTKSGKPSFQKNWLAGHTSDLAKLVMEKRKLLKISGTFIRNYILEGNVGGRIHCMFNPLRSDDSGAVSGRFSSQYPNLQNIPSRDKELGPICRSMFLPEEGMQWGRIDWSQIEFRFLVHFATAANCSGSQLAADMYNEDKTTDFHSMAASILNGGREFSKADRELAKTSNFGIVYGLGKKGLASNLGLSVEEAEPILKKFHSKLPWLKDIYNLAMTQAQRKGYIRTLLGRRQRFGVWEKRGQGQQVFLHDKDYQELDKKDRLGWQRARTHKALNALLQGSAADLMKKSMVLAYESGIFDSLQPHLTVHDELDVSIPPTIEGSEAFKELVHVMETTVKLNVPVLASADIGRNWAETI